MIRRRHLTAVCAAALLLVACSSEPTTSAPIDEPTSATGPVSAPSQSTHGTVSGTAPAAQNGFTSVVVLQPKDTTDLPPPAFPAVMDQVQMAFTPDMLFARTGFPVEFMNSDDEMHNMNVKEGATREQAFNAAVPPGSTYAHTFKSDGFYSVTCDVHPSMTAQLLVTSTPFATSADAAGNFAFNDVPPGEYLLTSYAGSERHEKSVVVAGAQTDVQIGTD